MNSQQSEEKTGVKQETKPKMEVQEEKEETVIQYVERLLSTMKKNETENANEGFWTPPAKKKVVN